MSKWEGVFQLAVRGPFEVSVKPSAPDFVSPPFPSGSIVGFEVRGLDRQLV
jgi:hypothetical protein